MIHYIYITKEVKISDIEGKTKEKLLEEQRNKKIFDQAELQEKVNASIDIVADKDKKLETFVSALAEQNAKSSRLEQELGDQSKITDDIESQPEQLLEDYAAELEKLGLTREAIKEMCADIAKMLKKKFSKK